jgi:hypothetical protein
MVQFEEEATWVRISKVLTKEVLPAPAVGVFYQAVVLTVLLCNSESLVLPHTGLPAFKRFHMGCARRITVMKLTRWM